MSEEEEIKYIIYHHYKQMKIEGDYINCIKKEYDFSKERYKGPTADFLVKTEKENYVIIECKSEATSNTVGQVLGYREYLKDRLQISDDIIKTLVIAFSFHDNFFKAMEPVKTLIIPYQWKKYVSSLLSHHEILYYIFSLVDKKDSQVIMMETEKPFWTEMEIKSFLERLIGSEEELKRLECNTIWSDKDLSAKMVQNYVEKVFGEK